MIHEMLATGKEYARTRRELCAALNLTEREITRQIEKERREGRPICASTGSTPGYFLAATQEEMENYCNNLHHRAGEIYKTRAACLDTIKHLPSE